MLLRTSILHAEKMQYCYPQECYLKEKVRNRFTKSGRKQDGYILFLQPSYTRILVFTALGLFSQIQMFVLTDPTNVLVLLEFTLACANPLVIVIVPWLLCLIAGFSIYKNKIL